MPMVLLCFRRLVKGAAIGGAFGKGQVYRGNKITGKTSLVHLSIGFQLGGRAFSEIIFFQDKRAYNEFISGAFEFDVKASAVTITVGVQRKPAPPVKLPAQALGRQPADRLRQSTLKGWQY